MEKGDPSCHITLNIFQNSNHLWKLPQPILGILSTLTVDGNPQKDPKAGIHGTDLKTTTKPIDFHFK